MSTLAPTAPRYPTPAVVCVLDLVAKALLVMLLLTAMLYPELGNLEGKGATERAIGYPLLAFSVPVLWYVRWRDRSPFPWAADLLVTLTCFSDTLGNRLDLYDRVRWFDDVMHLVNTGVLTAAFLLLTLPRRVTRRQVVERLLAFGVTAALAWELAEYVAFLSTSQATDRYADTLGDLTLGTLGSVAAGLMLHRAWRRGRLRWAVPVVESVPFDPRAEVPRAPQAAGRDGA